MKVDGATKTKKQERAFSAQAFLDSAGVARIIVEFGKKDVIFSQWDICEHVMYVQKGTVKLSVVSHAGKEAIVAMLGPGDFLGEGGLTGQLVRIATATATTPATLLVIGLSEMSRALHAEHALSDRFIGYMLLKAKHPNRRRLGRSALQFQRKTAGASSYCCSLATVKETTCSRPFLRYLKRQLAEMINAPTRSRVNFFMKKFEKLGFCSSSRWRAAGRQLPACCDLARLMNGILDGGSRLDLSFDCRSRAFS